MLQQGVILFDGVCNLCNGAVNFIIDQDQRQQFQFTSLQSPTGQKLLRIYNLTNPTSDSVVLIQNGRAYTKSEAVLNIAQKLGGFWPLLTIFRVLPLFLRDNLYDFVARNRYRWLGRTESCRIPTPDLKGRFLD